MPLLQGDSSMTSQGGIYGGFLTAAASKPWDVSLVAQGVWTPWDRQPSARPASIGGRDPLPARNPPSIARRNPKVQPFELSWGFADKPHHGENEDFST